MESVIIINREDAQKPVEIVFTETNKTAVVFIQPMSRAKLPPGAVVSPSFLKMNPKIQLASVAKKVVAPAVVAKAVTPTASANTVASESVTASPAVAAKV